MINTNLTLIQEIVRVISKHYDVNEVQVTSAKYFEIHVTENEEFDYDTVEEIQEFDYIDNFDKDTEKFIGYFKDLL